MTNSSTSPLLRHVQCLDSRGLHRMGYWQWGDPANPRVVVCVHGLTRQGRDFDTLARELSADFRVVCPDVVGRGQSDWLADPMGYTLPGYVADMVTLLARLDARQVDWVGTSMGGLIGIGVASLAGTPLRRLVVNDVGPTLEAAALARIGAYVGLPVRWTSLQQAAADMAAVSRGFGAHSPEQWLELCRHQVVPEGSSLKPHYDPAIAVAFAAITPEIAQAGELMTWAAWDRIACPTLLLRGAESDLLSAKTAQLMTQRGPKAALVEFAGVGHAPTLIADDQRRAVCEFLRAA